MTFLISKLVAIFVQPLNWVILLFLVSLIFKSKKKKCIQSAFILLCIFSNPFLFNTISKMYEGQPVAINSLDTKYDYGILLGGFSTMDFSTDSPYFISNSGDRLITTLQLYKAKKIDKVLVTSGSGNIWSTEIKEAIIVQDFLLQQGVDSSDVVIETESKNTYENATYTKALLDSIQPNANCLLITSAFHMPRSKAIFKKQKFNFATFSTDFLHRPLNRPKHIFLPRAVILYRWKFLLKEWVGYISYKMMGRL